jgi:NADPH-dependent 2,4-dienoyl-CoA reductase/sulfur reductase-like enzyme
MELSALISSCYIGVGPSSRWPRRRPAPRKVPSTDERQATSAPGVWAAGDCAESRHLVTGRPVHIALGTYANKQGRVAGINIGGGHAVSAGVLGTAITKLCTTEIARTGLGEAEAERAGFSVVRRGSRRRRRPGTSLPPPMTVKVVAERGTAPPPRGADRRQGQRPSASTPARWPSRPA